MSVIDDLTGSCDSLLPFTDRAELALAQTYQRLTDEFGQDPADWPESHKAVYEQQMGAIWAEYDTVADDKIRQLQQHIAAMEDLRAQHGITPQSGVA